MLIHLLILLLGEAGKSGGKAKGRKTKRSEILIIDCPACRNITKARKVDEVLEQGSGVFAKSVVQSSQICCETCGQWFDFQGFSADVSGVLHARQWGCPRCQKMNPNTTFICQDCGFQLE